jgi:hypothetical protein
MIRTKVVCWRSTMTTNSPTPNMEVMEVVEAGEDTMVVGGVEAVETAVDEDVVIKVVITGNTILNQSHHE